MDRLRLLIEQAVIMDVLVNREPEVAGSAGVLSILEAGYADGIITAQQCIQLFEVVNGKMTAAKARIIIGEIRKLVDVAPIDSDVLNQALALGWPQFDRAVQAACALQCDATHVITRSPRLYRSLQIPVLTPEEFLARHSIPGR